MNLESKLRFLNCTNVAADNPLQPPLPRPLLCASQIEFRYTINCKCSLNLLQRQVESEYWTVGIAFRVARYQQQQQQQQLHSMAGATSQTSVYLPAFLFTRKTISRVYTQIWNTKLTYTTTTTTTTFTTWQTQTWKPAKSIASNCLICRAPLPTFVGWFWVSVITSE